MASEKFADCSPYLKDSPEAPLEDYWYAMHKNDLELQHIDLENKVGLALFGAGRAGTIHLGNIVNNPRVNLLYVIEDQTSKWSDIKSYWKLSGTIFLHSKDKNKALEDDRVDAVLIASPTRSHEELVKASLEKHKAVFCEKPIAADMFKAAECYILAETVGKPLFCAFNRRFDPSFSNVRDRVHKGEVGKVHVMKICSRDSPLPSLEYLKISGGIFYDCAVHDVDIMCWILGEYPCRVYTSAHANIPEIKSLGDADTVAMILTFPSGTIGIIDLSRYSSYGYHQTIEVFGPHGLIMCNNQHPMPGIEVHKNQEGPRGLPIWYSFPSRYKLAYIREINHFLDVLQGKCEMLVKGKETIAISKIACAVEESWRQNKPIDLTWDVL